MEQISKQVEKDGLEELVFANLQETNKNSDYDEWVFNQLVNKASNLKKFEITGMMMAPCPNNRQTFLNVALNFINTSNNLRELKVSRMAATTEMGKDFLEKLANSDLTTLEHLDFEHLPRAKTCCKWLNKDH